MREAVGLQVIQEAEAILRAWEGWENKGDYGRHLKRLRAIVAEERGVFAQERDRWPFRLMPLPAWVGRGRNVSSLPPREIPDESEDPSFSLTKSRKRFPKIEVDTSRDDAGSLDFRDEPMRPHFDLRPPPGRAARRLSQASTTASANPGAASSVSPPAYDPKDFNQQPVDARNTTVLVHLKAVLAELLWQHDRRTSRWTKDSPPRTSGWQLVLLLTYPNRRSAWIVSSEEMDDLPGSYTWDQAAVVALLPGKTAPAAHLSNDERRGLWHEGAQKLLLPLGAILHTFWFWAVEEPLWPIVDGRIYYKKLTTSFQGFATKQEIQKNLARPSVYEYLFFDNDNLKSKIADSGQEMDSSRPLPYGAPPENIADIVNLPFYCTTLPAPRDFLEQLEGIYGHDWPCVQLNKCAAEQGALAIHGQKKCAWANCYHLSGATEFPYKLCGSQVRRGVLSEENKVLRAGVAVDASGVREAMRVGGVVPWCVGSSSRSGPRWRALCWSGLFIPILLVCFQLVEAGRW